MKISAELKKRKIQIIKFEASLNKYDKIFLISDTSERANEILRKVGLPKQWAN